MEQAILAPLSPRDVNNSASRPTSSHHVRTHAALDETLNSGSNAALVAPAADIHPPNRAHTEDVRPLPLKPLPVSINPALSAPPVVGQEASDESSSLPEPEVFSRPPKSFLSHRHHRKGARSIDSVPRQTIMKAMITRPPPTSDLTIASALNELRTTANGRESERSERREPMTSRRLSLSEALNDRLTACTLSPNNLASLASPCFFHKRFTDDSIEKILDEIRDDEWMSHSRLMQTATGVREVSKQLARRPIKRAVRNIMIVTKARDNSLVTLTRELTEWLLTTPRYGSQLGVNVYVDAKLRHSKRFGAASLVGQNPKFEQMLRYWTPDLCWSAPEKFDLVLTLGGDGTVLFTSWLFQRVVPPILSFSLGSLGFLTPFPFFEFRTHLDKIMGDSGMRVNLRMRFTCTVYRAPNNWNGPGSPTVNGPAGAPQAIEAEQFEVLNELVIDRGPSPYVSNLELYGDDELLTIVQADGCIFSTPTGSTAYSLSAGGSLVHPDIPAILLTPICPHTLSFRPMVLSDSMLLRVGVPANSRATAYCAFDGKGRVELRQGDYVTIAASQYPFPTVLSQPQEWFESISRTLRWNTRGATQKGWDGAEKEGEEDKFDIDIDGADDPGHDSGYSAEGSSAGGGASPVRRNTGMSTSSSQPFADLAWR